MKKIILNSLILAFILCGCLKNKSIKLTAPQRDLIELEKSRSDRDRDSVKDRFETDQDSDLFQVPRLLLSAKSKIDLELFHRDGRYFKIESAPFDLVHGPNFFLPMAAKEIAQGGKLESDKADEFFASLDFSNQCWIFRDLFHGINFSQASMEPAGLTRLTLRIDPYLYLLGMSMMHLLEELKMRFFVFGENGHHTSLKSGEVLPEDVREFKVTQIMQKEDFRLPEIEINLDKGVMLELAMGKARHFSLCIQDYKYGTESGGNSFSLSTSEDKAKKLAVPFYYSNGEKFEKYFVNPETTLAEFLTHRSFEYQMLNHKNFVIDSKKHLDLERALSSSLQDFELVLGPWMKFENGQGREMDLAAEAPNKFTGEKATALFYFPAITLMSKAHLKIEGHTLSHFKPGGMLDLKIEKKVKTPIVSSPEIIFVQAQVETCQRGWGDDPTECFIQAGWCEIYHRKLVHKTVPVALAAEDIKKISVKIGQRSFKLEEMTDPRFSYFDSSGAYHVRFKAPVTLDKAVFIFPQNEKEMTLEYGYLKDHSCDFRKAGRAFKFLNYEGTKKANFKSEELFEIM